MKIGENLLNEVLNEEKSILVDFDQFITLVNKWKLNGFMKDIHGSKKKNTPKRPQCRHYSSIWFTFSIEDNCKDPWRSVQWRFQLINGTITGRSTWRSLTIFGCWKSCLDLIVLNAWTVKRQKRGGGRISEKREKGATITLTLSLLTLFLICETIWPKHNFKKLLRK